MPEKKRVFESEVIALPPIKMVLGEVPSPDAERIRKPGERLPKPSRAMENAVQRLIMHLKDKQ